MVVFICSDLFYFQFDSLLDQINVLLKWCFCKTGGKRKVWQAAFEFLWLSCHKLALLCFRLHQGCVKGQDGLGQHQNELSSITQGGNSFRSIPRLSLLGMQGPENFRECISQPTTPPLPHREEKLSNSHTLTSANTNFNLRCVSTSGERGEHSPVNTHLGDGWNWVQEILF